MFSKTRNDRTHAGLALAILTTISSTATSASPPAAGLPEVNAPTAVEHELKPISSVPRFQAPQVDLEAVAAEDVQREAAGLPPRFAIANTTRLTPSASGSWEELDGETLVWRLRIASPGAVSLNVGFERFRLPPGALLSLYASDLSEIVRPFTDLDNAAHHQLWTPIIRTDEVVVELTILRDSIDDYELELTSVNVGYRRFGPGSDPTASAMSGSCNVDVVCPEGDAWRLEVQSVAVISTGGSAFCTGFMVNNTAVDLRPYFMTANHCGIDSGNAPSLVAYWNYENSWCRPPGSPQSGQPGDGMLNQFNTGAFWRAGYAPSDMTLVELDSDPLPEWEISYAGWNNTSADPTMAVAIHHPQTDEKRISFEFDPTTTTTYLQNAIPGDGTHIRIEDWDLGTTEPGSSGSPLFDQDHHVTGQLHGGFASCSSQTSDWYGRFSRSWTGGGTPSSSLSSWLDPSGTGLPFIDTVSINTLCTSAGAISLDRQFYACQDVATVSVIDCDLNLSETQIDTATATVVSTTDPTGETVSLTETGVNTARFNGPFTLSTTDTPGELHVQPGDTVTARYFDADDGQGSSVQVESVATIDCTAPIISNIQVVDIAPRNATISFQTNEPSRGVIHYGTACAVLDQSAEESELLVSLSIPLEGLLTNTTYFFSVEAVDEAGNVSLDDNGGLCHTFTTPDAIDFFTEQFNGDNDLDGIMLLFTPDSSISSYSGCAESIVELPTAPTGTILNFSPGNDDGSAAITLGGGAQVLLYDTAYSTFYVGSNGYITFGSADTDYTETLADHFSLPRISGLFDDLNLNSGGSVTWAQLQDRAVVSYVDVPEFSTTNSNTFQIEMYFDGRIVVSLLSIAASDGLTGLSEGNGVDPDFAETDLSTAHQCAPPDCNGNGTPDDEDIALGNSLDCNANGIPDECDLASGGSEDCNSNGVPDECDMGGGQSADCNANSIPDECDLATGGSADCNANAVPDECDMSGGVSEDCNSNQMPDECDILDGASIDYDENGIPDECQLVVPLVNPIGGRSFEITPQPSDGTIPIAIGLIGAASDPAVSCLQAFVQADGALAPTPVFQLPSAWATLRLVDGDILPGTTYEVFQEFISGPISDSVAFETWMWGDVNDDGVANFVDVQFQVLGFQGNFSNAALESLDIWPCTPDGVVNFEDIQRGVRAFQGISFNEENCPSPCP
ncbi:MAG: trypsin-like peptidase domain-containing protein [Phycisphaerae bacterium]